MTKPLATTEAEIEALPCGAYQCVDGLQVYKGDPESGPAHFDLWGVEYPSLDAEDIVRHGGIAGRLVLERVPQSGELTCDHCPRRMTASVQGDNGWEHYCEQHYAEAYPQTTAEAQRDRAMELLRQAKDLIEQHSGCDEDGVKRFGRGYCDLHDFAADARAALAKLDQATVKQPSSDE